MLKELKSQHRNIIQMAFNGYKNNEIAERLGMTPSSVSTILRSPLGQAYLNGLQDRAQEATLDVRKKLVTLNKSALDTFERLLNPVGNKVPAAVQFNAAKDVLDRNGYKAPDRLNIDMTFQTKSDEELDAEIAAIEASINKMSLPKEVNNLPESKDSLNQNLNQGQQDSADHTDSINSPDSSDVDDTTSLSLEDYSFFDIDEATEEDDITSLEDPEVLASPSFDPFHNLNRG